MLLLYALARPIASSLSPASTSFDSITGECIDITSCRTTTGIIWSCLSVIFICTWVAIHPNIPLVEVFNWTERKWTGHRWHPAAVIYNNVELMVIALLAPECMILWAMRQREQAKKIRDKFKDKYGWGMSHGFFVIMGGFALYDGDKFCGYLWDRDRGFDQPWQPYDGQAEGYFEEIKVYYERHQALDNMDENNEGTLTPPASHENSSATETLPLSLSSEPTTILEFLIAKGHITLTEDEIKDRSHADVIAKSIAVMQTTWFILQVIARAVDGLAITELEIVTIGFALLNFGTYFLWWNKPLGVRHPVRVHWRQTERSLGGDKGGQERGIWRVYWEGAGAIIHYVSLSSNKTKVRLLLLLLWIPYHIFFVCYKILWDEDDSDLAMPISSRLDNNPLHLYIIVYVIAALFGAIHCIAWVFQFPTHTEHLLCCISAVAIAIVPVAMGFLHGYLDKFLDSAPDWITNMVIAFTFILPLAYVVFRISLIVIAFTSLRDLPSSAYQTVEWTTFFPHIG